MGETPFRPRRARALRLAASMVWAASFAGVAWTGWHAMAAAHAEACAVPATVFEPLKALLCGSGAWDVRGFLGAMFATVAPLFLMLAALLAGAERAERHPGPPG